jgi:AraC family transcriptional activator of pobA
MRTSAGSRIQIHDIFREPGEKVRPVTVNHNEGLLPQKRIWLSPHRKNYFLLMYIKEGSGRHWVDTVPYEFRADTLFFSTPEQVHVKEDVKTSGAAICFTSEFYAMEQNADLLKLPFIQNIPIRNELILTPEDKIEIPEIIRHIIKEYKHPVDLHDEMLYAYIRVLLIYIGRIYNRQFNGVALGQRQELYRRFQSSIEDNYKRIRDVNTYADMLNISVSHLNALIREQTGKTVMMHLHDRQILEAKRLLYSTGMSVKEIAFNLGFRDTSYFNRFFKRITSTTPLEYRTTISE